MGGSYYKTSASVDEYTKLAEGINGQKQIDKLKDYIMEGASILELGSGPGSDYEILSEEFEVTGSDFSAEFLRRLKLKFPKGEFIPLDASTLEIDKSFDAIYSNKVLHHLSDDELEESIEIQSEILNQSGIICHTFWRGMGSEEMKGMFINKHEIEDLKQIFSPYFHPLVLEYYTEFEDADSILLIAEKK